MADGNSSNINDTCVSINSVPTTWDIIIHFVYFNFQLQHRICSAGKTTLNMIILRRKIIDYIISNKTVKTYSSMCMVKMNVTFLKKK